jgi:hypothetical protein
MPAGCKSGALITVALLTACSSGPQLALNPAVQPAQGVGTVASAALLPTEAGTTPVHPDPSESWISPDAVNAPALLYVSDSKSYDVYMYSFPALKLTGKLTGFFEPQGECSDKRGDVWIANTGSFQILEYARGRKNPIRSLSDPSGHPVSCAIDPITGNLAVTDLFGNSGAGGVLVYKNAAGTPTPYSNPSQFYYYFDGYDAKGNLYVSGQSRKRSYMLSVLPKGKKSMSTVTVRGGTIYFPGTVQIVGATLALGDQKCKDQKRSCLYQATISGTTATIKHTTPLNGSCDVGQVVIEGRQLAGGERCGIGSSTNVWAYPAGGAPTKRAKGVGVPVGAAISK